MRYWLDLFTPPTWRRFMEHGGTITGFRERQRKAAFERVARGDVLLCYVVWLSRWCGVLDVEGSAFEESVPIFTESDDPFTVRFRVTPRVALEFDRAIPIQLPAVWNALSFTRTIAAGSIGWAQSAKLRQSLIEIPETDGKFLVDLLTSQKARREEYPLDVHDHRSISAPLVARTEYGEVPVVVPDREDDEEAVPTPPHSQRISHQIQAKLARLGLALGFAVWVPAGDKGSVSAAGGVDMASKLLDRLPINFDEITLKTIKNIDVLWLQRRAIVHAFEVEHTTAIYSGLLRMADLLALQPRIDIRLHIVAPGERRHQVSNEIRRPVFTFLEGGAMSQKCSFISYEAVDQISAQQHLVHLKESIIEEFEEFFNIDDA